MNDYTAAHNIEYVCLYMYGDDLEISVNYKYSILMNNILLTAKSAVEDWSAAEPRQNTKS